MSRPSGPSITSTMSFQWAMIQLPTACRAPHTALMIPWKSRQWDTTRTTMVISPAMARMTTPIGLALSTASSTIWTAVHTLMAAATARTTPARTAMIGVSLEMMAWLLAIHVNMGWSIPNSDFNAG